MSRGRHPSREHLLDWLESGAPDRVTRHVHDCESCMAQLDDLSELEPAVVARLGTTLAAPDEVSARTARAVDRRLRDRGALSVFADLFTVGGEWARIVLNDDPEEEAR